MAFPKHKRGVIVYRATNRITGDFYIGVTSRPLKARRYQHVSGAKGFRSSARKLAAAIREFGEAAFVWEVVAKCETGWEANLEEVRLIADLKPAYNIAPGGIGGRPECSTVRKPVLCLETGDWFPSVNEAADANGTAAGEISLVCGGKRRWARRQHYIFSGTRLDADARSRLIREIDAGFIERRRRVPRREVATVGKERRDRLGRSAAGPMTNARRVQCLADGKEYPSASSAAAAYGVAKSALIEMCLGKNGRASVGGLAFQYVGSAGVQ